MTMHALLALPAHATVELRLEARQEGYNFVETLQAQWESGENRFDGVGEVLYGYSDDGVLVAVGGLNRDPFQPELRLGRIRRVYVRQAWRKRGIAETLIKTLLLKARQEFSGVNLRTDNPSAAKLYERLGFVRISSTSATHRLVF